MEQPEGVSPSGRALVARKLKRIPGGGHGHRRRGAGTPWGTKDRFAEVEERDGRRQGVEAWPGQHPLRHEYPKISHTSDPWTYPLARPTQDPGASRVVCQQGTPTASSHALTPTEAEYGKGAPGAQGTPPEGATNSLRRVFHQNGVRLRASGAQHRYVHRIAVQMGGHHHTRSSL